MNLDVPPAALACEYEDHQRRTTAMHAALQFHANKVVDADFLVRTAKIFETYLKGES